MSRLATALVCLAIVAAGVAGTVLIFSTEPKAQRGGATKRTAMLVDVTPAERGDFRPVITALGAVEPAREVVVSPRVEGEVVSLGDSFTPGGFVQEGDVLLRLDASDYRNALEQRRSELRQALSDLAIEEGRQLVARQDLALLERPVEDLPENNRDLVLRMPQIEAARSRVESARAAVEQAELHLARTTLRAPFDAHVLTREVNVGSQVGPGDELARIVGIEEYWVVATVPLGKLRWLELPESPSDEGSAVTLRDRSAWAEGQTRRGRLARLVGALEDRTRMARVIISVPEPLGPPDGPSRRDEAGETDEPEGAADSAPLMIGSYVETSIEGRQLSDVIRVERALVRQDDTVWVMEEGLLRIREVTVRLRDATYAYVSDGLTDGDLIVTTNLATVTDGAPLRVVTDSSPPAADGPET